MSQRTLRLPDGGTLDLPIPSGFGAPIFALNDAEVTMNRALLPCLIGAGVGALVVWLVIRAGR